MKIEILSSELVKMGQDVINVLNAINKNGLQNATVQEVAAAFPGGTALDTACTTIVNDAVDVLQKIDTSLPGYAAAVRGIINDVRAAVLAQKAGRASESDFDYILHIVSAAAVSLAKDL
jgi:hypothetical protein